MKLKTLFIVVAMLFAGVSAGAQEKNKQQIVAGTQSQIKDPSQSLVIVKTIEGLHTLGVSFLSGQSSYSNTDYTWIIGTSPSIKSGEDVTITYSGLKIRGEVRFLDEETGFFLIYVDNTNIPAVGKNVTTQSNYLAYFSNSNAKVEKSVAVKKSSVKIDGNVIQRFDVPRVSTASNVIFFDNSGNLLGLSIGTSSKENGHSTMDLLRIQRFHDAIMQTEVIKLLAIDKKHHSEFGKDFVKWYLQGATDDNQKYFKMYRDANLVLESQDSDKLEKHTKELFKIAQLYYAEQSKRRPSTNIKVINLVCNLLSSNRQVQRAMTFAVNTDTSTVNGYSANINENSIAYEYSSQDGTKYKVNIDRISGFGVIGTAQFPLLMSGPCNKVEGKAF